MARGIEIDRQERTVVIVLNYPPLNILQLDHIEALTDIFTSVKADPNVDVVWMRGGETKAFCAGVSIADHLRDRATLMLGAFRRLSETMLALPQVIMTEVFGPVLGGGMELVLLSDLVVSADDAKFGQPEILLAATPPVAAALLPFQVGWREASRLCLLGETVDAAWAKERGLLTRLVPRSDLQNAAQGVVNQLLKMSSPALRTTKQIMRGPDAYPIKAVGYGFDLYLSDLLPTDDSQEGIEAFLAKRPPEWQHH